LITGNVIPIDSNTDPRLNNVLGYAKYGKYIWGEAVAENPSAKVAGTEQPEPESVPDEKFGKAGLTQVK
jgi:plasmid segregation protein ParM